MWLVKNFYFFIKKISAYCRLFIHIIKYNVKKITVTFFNHCNIITFLFFNKISVTLKSLINVKNL